MTGMKAVPGMNTCLELADVVAGDRDGDGPADRASDVADACWPRRPAAAIMQARSRPSAGELSLLPERTRFRHPANCTPSQPDSADRLAPFERAQISSPKRLSSSAAVSASSADPPDMLLCASRPTDHFFDDRRLQRSGDSRPAFGQWLAGASRSGAMLCGQRFAAGCRVATPSARRRTLVRKMFLHCAGPSRRASLVSVGHCSGPGLRPRQ